MVTDLQLKVLIFHNNLNLKAMSMVNDLHHPIPIGMLPKHSHTVAFQDSNASDLLSSDVV